MFRVASTFSSDSTEIHVDGVHKTMINKQKLPYLCKKTVLIEEIY